MSVLFYSGLYSFYIGHLRRALTFATFPSFTFRYPFISLLLFYNSLLPPPCSYNIFRFTFVVSLLPTFECPVGPLSLYFGGFGTPLVG